MGWADHPSRGVVTSAVCLSVCNSALEPWGGGGEVDIITLNVVSKYNLCIFSGVRRRRFEIFMWRKVGEFLNPNGFIEYATYRNAWRCGLRHTSVMSLYGSQSAA